MGANAPATTNELAQRMHRALIASGFTQLEAANRAGVPRDVVHKAVQRGSVPRSAETRNAVAKALNVSPSWLWYGETMDQPVETKPVPAQARVAVERAAPASIPSDAYVELFETDAGEPFVSAGSGLLVSPSGNARLGDVVWVRIDGYEGPAKYTGSLGNEIVLSLAGGIERRIQRSDVGAIMPVLATVRGVVIR